MKYSGQQVGTFKSNKLAGGDGQENHIFGDALKMLLNQGGNDSLVGGANGAVNEIFGEARSMYFSKGQRQSDRGRTCNQLPFR